MPSEKVAVVGLPQIGVRFLQGYLGVSRYPWVPCWQQQLECNWTLNLTELWGRSSRVLNQLAPDNFLAQSSVLSSLVLLRTKFQVPSFLFSSLWNLVGEI